MALMKAWAANVIVLTVKPQYYSLQVAAQLSVRRILSGAALLAATAAALMAPTVFVVRTLPGGTPISERPSALALPAMSTFIPVVTLSVSTGVWLLLLRQERPASPAEALG